MSQYVHGPVRTFTANGALGEFLRVIYPSGVLALAGANDACLGTMDVATFAGATRGQVRMRTAEGTCRMVANAAISKGAKVYAAAGGKIGPSGAVLEGYAMEAAGADGDVIEVEPTSATSTVIDVTEVVTATNVIAGSESGSTFFLNSATEFVSTLPPPVAGLKFRFIVTAAPSGASYTIVTDSSANIIKGNVVSSQDAGGNGDSETAGGDTISFVDGVAVAGDKVEVYCDGTNWFAYGVCKTFNAITITTAT